MKLRHWFGLLLIVLTFAINADEHWKKPEYLEQSFIEVALRNEYSNKGYFVRRWEKPIKVWLDHQVGDAELHTKLVKMHLKHLEQLINRPIELVSTSRKANLKIVFTRQAYWKEQVRLLFGEQATKAVHGAVCMANIRVNTKNEIERAGVIIPVDQARMHGKLVTCIVEEITQVMGLPNDSEAVYPSIFNDKTPEDLLSGMDSLLLKMLYDPSIKTGMNEQQVRPILRKLIRSWQKDGTIEQASQSVKQGELYPLLGYK